MNLRKLRIESLEERTFLAVVAGGLGQTAVLVAPTETTAWVVNTLEDPEIWEISDDVLSLREAIDCSADGDRIIFDVLLAGGTIALSGSQLEINRGIIIDASDIGGITIDAGGKSRVFYVNGETDDIPVELINLTITGGGNPYGFGGGVNNVNGMLTVANSTIFGNSGYRGGGIESSGTLTIINSTVMDNSATGPGGGIFVSGELTVVNSAVSGNSAIGKNMGYGGAICNSIGATLTIANSTISGNYAYEGGGIYNSDKLTLTNSTVSENNASYSGGGIENGGTLTLTDCLVSGNSAHSRGGGGILNNGTLTITDSVIFGNSAHTSTDSGGIGGGICNANGTLILTNSAIYGNSAYRGGGICNQDATLTITNSDIYWNGADSGGGVTNDRGVLTVTGANIFDNSAYVSGGGIVNDFGILTVTGSSVSRNYADVSGGGIENDGALIIADSVLSGNFANFGGGGVTNVHGMLTISNSLVSGNSTNDGNGGGIESYSMLTITNSTISANSAKYCGGGIYYSGTLTVVNSIVAINYADDQNDISQDEYQEDLFSGSNNIIGINPGFVTAPIFDETGNLINCDEMDFTLSPISLAINAGNNSFVTGETDLAGNPRIVGWRIDLGAFEYQKNEPVILIPLDVPEIISGSKGGYVSAGANRHWINWDNVKNATSYELAYSVNGTEWITIPTADTSALITGLPYGADVQYKVYAIGDGTTFSNSDWSDVKVYNVCPMDINNDGDISGGDRQLLSSAWLAEEGDEEYRYYCDINADGDISNGDRAFLSNNWLVEAWDDDLIYPVASSADTVFSEFASLDLGVEVDVF